MIEKNYINKKRKIILKNSKSSNNLTREEMKKKSDDFDIKIFEFKNESGGCGDILQISISFKKKGNEEIIKEFFFSAQSDRACIIVSSLTNIFFRYLKEKENKDAEKIIKNFLLMIKGEKYDLVNFPDLILFNDIKKFNSRIDCVYLVAEGIKNIIINQNKKNEI